MLDQRIRRVEERDVDAVVRLVHELAEYERAPNECHLTSEQLHEALFTQSPALFGHVAEVDGAVVGCALWFLNFSTWRGTHGIYLEDLFVRPSQRGSGLGRALLSPSRRSAYGAASSGWSGGCWTGTNRRSASTGRWARWRWTSGPSSASPTTPSTG